MHIFVCEYIDNRITESLSTGSALHPSGVLPHMFLHGLPVSVLGPGQHRDWICHLPHWRPRLLYLHLL